MFANNKNIFLGVDDIADGELVFYVIQWKILPVYQDEIIDVLHITEPFQM